MKPIFCVCSIRDGEPFFMSPEYSKACAFLQSVPDTLKECFVVVRYDPNDNWQPDTSNN